MAIFFSTSFYECNVLHVAHVGFGPSKILWQVPRTPRTAHVRVQMCGMQIFGVNGRDVYKIKSLTGMHVRGAVNHSNPNHAP